MAKHVQKEWEEYKAQFPKDAPPELVDAFQEAFYAGAAFVESTLWEKAHAGSGAGGAAWIKEVREELIMWMLANAKRLGISEILTEAGKDVSARRAAQLYADMLPSSNPLKKEINLAITCVGMTPKPSHNSKRRFKCCERAGEYNGYPGRTSFTCPNNCGCHD